MQRTWSRVRGGLQRLAMLGVVLVLGGCGGAPSPLNPQGPAAAQIALLSWVMFGMAGAIFAGVVGLTLLALFRRRPDTGAAARPISGRALIIGGGVILPAAVIAVLLGLTLWSVSALAARPTPLTIRVTAWQWWWEVYYPSRQFYTANEIYIPVGQPVTIELTSGDVVHNFWVPELHGKFDLIPGRSNSFWLQADQPGEFQGVCAEYCGLQHAKMRFVVIALPADEFEEWAAAQASTPLLPEDPLVQRGQQIFLGSACVYCHAVAGTNASSRFGPDLSHIASRRTLAAGVLENNRGNLAGWLLNPQTIKPGTKMPPTALPPEDLQALLAYLESLK